MFLMKRGTRFPSLDKVRVVSLSGPWQFSPSPRPAVTGSALVCCKLFLGTAFTLQHLPEGLGAWYAPRSAAGQSCQGLTGKQHGPSSGCARNHAAAEMPLRQPWGLTFKAALRTDNKLGPETPLRSDFPQSYGSRPQIIFQSGELKHTPSSQGI